MIQLHSGSVTHIGHRLAQVAVAALCLAALTGCGAALTARIECERAALDTLPVNLELVTARDGARLLGAVLACRAPVVSSPPLDVSVTVPERDAGQRL